MNETNDTNNSGGNATIQFVVMICVVAIAMVFICGFLFFVAEYSDNHPVQPAVAQPGPFNSEIRVEGVVNCVGASTAGCDQVAAGVANVLNSNANAINASWLQSALPVLCLFGIPSLGLILLIRRRGGRKSS